MDGILIIDKSAGVTSHDVVARVRHVLGERRVGHAGTLDPLATGVLVLGIGKGTRILEYLVGQPKRYHGTVRLGITTTTYDVEGEVTHRTEGPWPKRARVEATLARFRGSIEQRPPVYSAVRQDGERLYEKARRGETVHVEPRRVTVHELHLLRYEPPHLDIDVTCSKGTYIRSLAHDIGEALGVGGHLTALRRLEVGPFSVEEAVSLDILKNAADGGRLASVMLTLNEGLPMFPQLGLTGVEARRLAHGQFLAAPPAEGLHRAVLDERLIAVVEYDEGRASWRPRKVFVDPNLLPDHSP